MRHKCASTSRESTTNMMQHSLLHTAVLFLTLLLHATESRDSHWFSVIIPTGQIECFYEVLEKDVPVRVSTVVMDGGRRDIRVLVRHTVDESQIAAAEPRNVKVRTFVDMQDDKGQHLDFDTDTAGEWSFCFDNRPVPPTTGLNVHSVPSQSLDVKDAISSADKFVAFELHFHASAEQAHETGDAPEKQDKHLTESEDKLPADIEQSKGINDLISSLREKIDDVASESNYYHFREEQNRNTAEAANTRVAWLTIMETSILLIVTACEIFLVRSWFASNSKNQRSRSWA